MQLWMREGHEGVVREEGRLYVVVGVKPVINWE